jgi:hypothetical protein
MYKVSFYTHRVAVLIAESMMLMLSLDVLSLSLIGICHVGSTGSERRELLRVVPFAAKNRFGCWWCLLLLMVVVALEKEKVGPEAFVVVGRR